MHATAEGKFDLWASHKQLTETITPYHMHVVLSL